VKCILCKFLYPSGLGAYWCFQNVCVYKTRNAGAANSENSWSGAVSAGITASFHSYQPNREASGSRKLAVLCIKITFWGKLGAFALYETFSPSPPSAFYTSCFSVVASRRKHSISPAINIFPLLYAAGFFCINFLLQHSISA
jgi:hypothetical protein